MHLKEKVQRLSFFKDRVSSFLGKTEELFLHFAKNISPFLCDYNKDVSVMLPQLRLFVDESIFFVSVTRESQNTFTTKKPPKTVIAAKDGSI